MCYFFNQLQIYVRIKDVKLITLQDNVCFIFNRKKFYFAVLKELNVQ